jgi:hypothetical protein
MGLSGLADFRVTQGSVDGTVKPVWLSHVFGLLRVMFRQFLLYTEGRKKMENTDAATFECRCKNMRTRVRTNNTYFCSSYRIYKCHL